MLELQSLINIEVEGATFTFTEPDAFDYIELIQSDNKSSLASFVFKHLIKVTGVTNDGKEVNAEQLQSRQIKIPIRLVKVINEKFQEAMFKTMSSEVIGNDSKND